ncbi:MAG: hypothetical protein O2985_14560, partial [Proteobacteria bacterium]|nr:hypothetical protein [Pseudomonadota bacterium]
PEIGLRRNAHGSKGFHKGEPIEQGFGFYAQAPVFVSALFCFRSLLFPLSFVSACCFRSVRALLGSTA